MSVVILLPSETDKQQTNVVSEVVETFLKGSSLSAEEKAKSCSSKHLCAQLLVLGVIPISEAFCEGGYRGRRAQVSAFSRRELLALSESPVSGKGSPLVLL